ncbi:ASKHA domain-containing protein [Hippea alviniae]|uniref:ASKHA domain-containing protein n=1 Tax=Hippea alviniae TaxID=1279027 RepID=UPI0003B66BB0|nr:ASKHA domain-containing protein [Hippea alviniae]
MKLTVKVDGSTKEIEFSEKENLLKLLHSNGIYINAYCSGRGICKKCIVKFTKNAPKTLKLEEETFGKKTEEGYRLACLHSLNNDAEIEVSLAKPVFAEFDAEVCSDDEKTHVAIDIGTTTIAVAVIKNRKLFKTAHILNPQVAFGADVISRIAYSNEGNLKVLAESLKKALKETISSLCANKIESIVVSANPTMLTFLLEKDPKPIGEYPYTPPFKGSFEGELFSSKLYIPPVVSAFVGADITAALSILPEDKDYLFIDIGTNCEFILKKDNSYFASSVPAGPALEGANIDYGTIAQDGAIYKVEFKDTFKVYTINDKPAIGITGSGLISSIALLREFEIIDNEGRLLEAWETEAPFSLINRIKKEGFLLDKNIYLTQNSIRNFQLVKASLNAALKIILKKTDLKIPKRIYIAGGFSKSLAKEEILKSSLLSFDGEFVMLGNSSLAGSLRLFCKMNREKVERISQKIEYLEIANESEFEKLYIESMGF